MTVVDEVEVTHRGSNVLAVLSVVAGVLALASMVGLGIPVPAAFAVGAGHVALQQIGRRAQRGRRVALTGLALGYAVAVWGLALSLTHLPALFASF